MGGYRDQEAFKGHLEVFAFVDFDCDGLIDFREFVEGVRALGHVVTVDEFEEIRKREFLKKELIDFDQFITILKSFSPPSLCVHDHANEIVNGLRTYKCIIGDETEKISLGQLRTLLTKTADRFDERQYYEFERLIAPREVRSLSGYLHLASNTEVPISSVPNSILMKL